MEELTYPFHDATITVTSCGRICFKWVSSNQVTASGAWQARDIEART